MMVLILLAIWAFGAFVLYTDPKNISIRWASATAFVGGCGFLSAVFDETLLPLLTDAFPLSTTLPAYLLAASRISSFLCQVGLPYTFLMFAVYSGDFLSRRTKTVLQYASLLPPLAMLAVTPIYPVLQFNYWLMITWVFPYFIGASLILVLLYWKEKDPLVKKSRLFTNILVIFPILLVFITIYVMRTQNNYDAWRYNSLIVGIQFLLILVISVKYGFLGVKWRVEKRRLDSTLRAMTSGAQIVNHTIKNEVGKISLYTQRMKDYAEETGQPVLREDLQVIEQSTRHLLDMVSRIQGQLQEIRLREEVTSPASLIQDVLSQLRPLAEQQRIELKTELDDRWLLLCDPVQLREILINLSMNAIEAMKGGGTLTLQLFLSKKHLVVAVADTGTGIAKENLPHVLDPFFSTKKTGKNFGLGLSYCYNVMQKHQGTLEIYSVKDEGTTVFLFFPLKRVEEAG
ncbi:HAMP domain-containing histidine kinase [Brevibacillus composti]|uniref:histidine kinase n=1 Tax=Brevibacillus composti TaxID=2796470 RepID=A0A7T5JNT1_9BACL|nr:HAMP domain-containing sensor histidine kinase [Brevibacillus composti]QQE74340.1 HAMP domain-containing histidine kinase [Brevibacillus composti]QUO41422.1 HAMP domain-containing histidine kinase [Brevibacillus composti]